MKTSEEPAVSRAAVRRFKDPAYVALAPTLGDLRERIVVVSTYRAMVAGFIAGEAQLFQQTESIDP